MKHRPRLRRAVPDLADNHRQLDFMFIPNHRVGCTIDHTEFTEKIRKRIADEVHGDLRLGVDPCCNLFGGAVALLRRSELQRDGFACLPRLSLGGSCDRRLCRNYLHGPGYPSIGNPFLASSFVFVGFPQYYAPRPPAAC